MAAPGSPITSTSGAALRSSGVRQSSAGAVGALTAFVGSALRRTGARTPTVVGPTFRRTCFAGVVAAFGLFASGTSAQQPAGAATVTTSVIVRTTLPSPADRSDVVVWLTPAGETTRRRPAAGRRFKIDQQNKTFSPHVLVVPIGSFVDFPNLDPIFHNVFSLFDGRRFDLGLYEAGTSRGVSFTRPGVCYVFCNIHPEMSAVVVAVDSPYYAQSGAAGTIVLSDVPPGRYRMSVWHERFKPEDPSEYPKEIVVAAPATTLPVVRLVEANRVPAPHTNKFGHDYTPPPPTTPAYP